MAELGRDQLKTRFETGDFPSQGDFTDLIDSAYNTVDDDLSGGGGETHIWGTESNLTIHADVNLNTTKLIGDFTDTTIDAKAVTGGHTISGKVDNSFLSVITGLPVSVSGYIKDVTANLGSGASLGGHITGGTITVATGGTANLYRGTADADIISVGGSFLNLSTYGVSVVNASNASTALGYIGDGNITANGRGSLIQGDVDSDGTMSTAGTGTMARGKSTGSGVIQATSNGGVASGYAAGAGILGAYGSAAHTFGQASGADAKILATNPGAIAAGMTTGGTIGSHGSGAFTIGRVGSNGQLYAVSPGASVIGYANGGNVTASGAGSHITGYAAPSSSMNASGNGSFISGNTGSNGSLSASGVGAFARGFSYGSASSTISASASGSFISGIANTAQIISTSGASGSFAHGYANSGGYIGTNGSGSIALGNATGANSKLVSAGSGAIAAGLATSGYTITATGAGSFAGGYASDANISAPVRGSFAWGNGCSASARDTAAVGVGLSTGGKAVGSAVVGAYNDLSNSSFLFSVGNGIVSARSNAFGVSNTGELFASNAVINTGIDYAERFEWLDGNVDEEDRVGLFVEFVGNKIVISDNYEEAFGIVSATPNIIGDEGAMGWKDKYVKDSFGRIQYDIVEHPASYVKLSESESLEVKILLEKENITYDEDGDPIGGLTENEYSRLKVLQDLDGSIESAARTERIPRLNPDYKESTEYISRADRKEWSAIGLLGQLKVRDDNTANVGDRVIPTTGGIATKSTSKVGYKVIKRIEPGIIQVLLK